MTTTIVLATIFLVSFTCIIRSTVEFSRRCAAARENLDPVRAALPRGLTSSNGCATLRQR